MRFVEFGEPYVDAYRRFQTRLGTPSDGTSVRSPFSYYLPSPGITLKRHLVIDESVEPEAVVGAVDVKIQDYVIAGTITPVAVVTYPVSLGIVEPRYATVAMFLFKKLTQLYPLNFLLGMGPPDRNVVARLTELLGWTLDPIPYFFLPIRLGPLIRKQFEGRMAAIDSALRLAAGLGLFRPADALLRSISRVRLRTRGLRTASVRRFDITVDAFWREYAKEVSFSLVRDSVQLNAMFPERVPAFERLIFADGDHIVGFAVLLVPDATDTGRFGDVTVATLVEFSVLNDHMESGAAALREHLFGRNVDAVIANTPHMRTIDCLRRTGFVARTTNVYLAASRQLQALLKRHDILPDRMVLTRGDGDGPIGLGVNL